jgi:hypothetical protein
MAARQARLTTSALWHKPHHLFDQAALAGSVQACCSVYQARSEWRSENPSTYAFTSTVPRLSKVKHHLCTWWEVLSVSAHQGHSSIFLAAGSRQDSIGTERLQEPPHRAPAMSASVCNLSRRKAPNSPPLPLSDARTLAPGDSGAWQTRQPSAAGTSCSAYAMQLSLSPPCPRWRTRFLQRSP